MYVYPIAWKEQGKSCCLSGKHLGNLAASLSLCTYMVVHRDSPTYLRLIMSIWCFSDVIELLCRLLGASFSDIFLESKLGRSTCRVLPLTRLMGGRCCCVVFCGSYYCRDRIINGVISLSSLFLVMLQLSWVALASVQVVYNCYHWYLIVMINPFLIPFIYNTIMKHVC